MSDSFRNDPLGDCSPLSIACIKALTDKMEDKRRFAASEIEKMTVEFSMTDNQIMINQLIKVLARKFCLSPNPNFRKGGLLGLATVMVGFKNGALSSQSHHQFHIPQEMLKEVVEPILTCFIDSDPRVRCYACESLFNVTKVAKGNILSFFGDIFNNLSKVVADSDLGVRSGAELLDQILKNIIEKEHSFDIQSLVPLLQEHIYTMNPFTRMFIVTWIRFLDHQKSLDLIVYLPQLLDGILKCLFDPADEIKASTLDLLDELLRKIISYQTDKLDLPSMIATLLKHAKNEREDPVQYTAIAWLEKFITSLMNNIDLIKFTPDILPAIFPCFAYQNNCDGSFMSSRDRLTPEAQRYPRDIRKLSSKANSELLKRITEVFGDRRRASGSESILSDLEPILEVLARELHNHDHPDIKLAVLEWLKALNRVEPELILASSNQQKLFQILLETLSDRSDVVVENALHVIAGVFCVENADETQLMSSNLEESLVISRDDDVSEQDKKKSPIRTQTSVLTKSTSTSSRKVAIATGDSTSVQSSTNISRFVQALCKMFREKEVVFEERGTFIILNLCSMLKPDMVYKSFAEILRDEKPDLKFAYILVQKLNQILLTTQPLFGLRSRLSNEVEDPEVANLFNNLYYAWCYSPIAALTLCLLANNFRLASEIVNNLSQSDISVDTLSQIDWVIQLIESPVFAPLRMRLLDVNSNQYLIQSLYGLLMILPQSDAYKKLSSRLDQVHKFMSAQANYKSVAPSTTQTQPVGYKPPVPASTSTTKKTNPSTNLEILMRHFSSIQNQRAKLNLTSDKY